jgi:hypothetical protein
LKLPVITVRLSITATWFGNDFRNAAQPGLSRVLKGLEPLGKPEAIIENESGFELLNPALESLACSVSQL